MRLINLYIVLLVTLSFRCETIVDVKVNEVDPYLVVDAWLTHEFKDQKIRLTKTQPYYKNEFASGVTGAKVVITDELGNQFDFIDDNEGNYIWTAADTFGIEGLEYYLSIEWNGNIYNATSSIKRVPKLDSITFTFEEGNSFIDDFYYAEFFATDPVGEGDSYWIRFWKNGEYRNKPLEIVLAYDASFSEGGGDGIPFIFPIRTSTTVYEQDINGNIIPPFGPVDTIPVNNKTVKINGSTGFIEGNEIKIKLKDKKVKGGIESYMLDGKPYSMHVDGNNSSIVKAADSIFIELHAITNEAWFFLSRVYDETNRPESFGALFATPPANVTTNIVPDNKDIPVVGFFSISNISSNGRKLTDNAIRIQPF